jgi:hypothetical protein
MVGVPHCGLRIRRFARPEVERRRGCSSAQGELALSRDLARIVGVSRNIGHRRAVSPFASDAADPCTLLRREDAERFIEEIRGDDAELTEPLRIEERELETGGKAFSTIKVRAGPRSGLAWDNATSRRRPIRIRM